MGVGHEDAGYVREEVEVALDQDHPFLAVGMHVERGPVFNGGPFLGAFWSFAPDSGARLRVGYEIAAPPWLAESVSVESDLGHRLTVIPAVEALTNMRLTTGLGFGVPIRLRPEPQIGGRLQASASFDFVTLRAAFDVYPGTSTLPWSFEGSIGPQLSF